MPVNKKSQIRINCLLRLMKEKKYPNYPILMKEMAKLDIAGTYRISQKTIQRDITFLKNEFNAPIRYDTEHKGYYLVNEYWDNVPFIEEVEMDAAVFGAHLAESIFPNSQIKSDITTGTEALWSKNTTSEPETMTLCSLIAHGSRTKIKPEIFQTIFEAWQKHNRLQVRYQRSGDGHILDMQIEPHILAFSENVWYLRARLIRNHGICVNSQPFLTLALQRFAGVMNIGGKFDPDMNEIKKVDEGFLFDLPRITEVKLKLKNSSLTALEYLTPIQEEKHPDGTLDITLQGIEEFRILNLVLTSNGNAVILAPETLKQKAIELSKNFIKQQENTK